MELIERNPGRFLSSGTERILATTGVVAMAGGSSLVWYFDPSKVNFLPVCPLYSMTGFACPGCGLTRGFHALFHGDILKALDYNALIPIFVVVLGYLFVALVILAVRGRGLPMIIKQPGWLVGLLVVMIVFGVVRNLPIYPFSVLFP